MLGVLAVAYSIRFFFNGGSPIWFHTILYAGLGVAGAVIAILGIIRSFNAGYSVTEERSEEDLRIT